MNAHQLSFMLVLYFVGCASVWGVWSFDNQAGDQPLYSRRKTFLLGLLWPAWFALLIVGGFFLALGGSVIMLFEVVRWFYYSVINNRCD